MFLNIMISTCITKNITRGQSRGVINRTSQTQRTCVGSLWKFGASWIRLHNFIFSLLYKTPTIWILTLIFSGGGTAFSFSSSPCLPVFPLENSEEYHHSKNLKKKMDMGNNTFKNSMTLLNTVAKEPRGFLKREKGACAAPAADLS